MHDHTFGQDRRQPGEKRTWIVIAVTLLMMVVEIAAGMFFGSMALLADGLHMGSHASALAISAFAYYYTRRHAGDTRFNFGTGKVNSLAAFASGVMLIIFAFFMAWESIRRLIFPVTIEFGQAIAVALIGLIVNAVCLVILGGHGRKHDDHSHSHDEKSHHHDQVYDDAESQSHHKKHMQGDLNLKSAYLHVAADILTSFLAVFALIGGKYLHLNFLDPLMGIVGALLIARWSIGLLRSTARVMLDMKAPEEVSESIKAAIESYGDNRLSDLHVWSIGPDIYAVEIAVVASNPMNAEDYYKLLPKTLE